MQLEEQEYVEMYDERGPPRPQVVDAAEEDQNLPLAPLPEPTRSDIIKDMAHTPSTGLTHVIPSTIDSVLVVATKAVSAQNSPIPFVTFEVPPLAICATLPPDSAPLPSSQLALLLLTNLRAQLSIFVSQMSLMSKLVAFCVIFSLTNWVFHHVSSALTGFLRSFVLYVLALDTSFAPQ